MPSPAFISPLPASFPASSRSQTKRTTHLRRPRPSLPARMVLHPDPSPSPPAFPSRTPDPLTETLTLLRTSPLVLCIRMDSPSLALSAASAALRGGIRCVEVALTTPDAPSVIRALSADFPSAVIGAGTVLTPADVAAAAAAEARFALSPVSDPALIPQIHRAGMLAVPGAATPTEIHTAHAAGARLVKIFPVNLLGGLAFVRAMQGPLGHIPLLPTSGVDEKGLRDYLSQSNVWCVGASRQILPKDALERGDWQLIERRARIWADIAAEYSVTRDVHS